MSAPAEALWLRSPDVQYPVWVGAALAGADRWRPYVRQQVLILTDHHVGPLWADELCACLRTLGVTQIDVLTLPAGEATKSLASAERVWDCLITHHHTRDTTVIGLGGGVIGDLTAFVAGSYLRGVDCIHVPTSLLAQVDASVGGKCGVNHPHAKNAIGLFYHPKAVITDMAYLQTLPARAYQSGLAEVLKYALIQDAAFLSYLDEHAPAVLARQPEVLQYVIATAIGHKIQRVVRDEQDRAERLHLNFGHTLGHALEAATQYQTYTHGEAVALGMVTAAFLSHQRGFISKVALTHIEDLLQRFGLPTVLEHIDTQAVMQALLHDKKRTLDGLRWVLLDALGHSVLVNDVSVAEITTALHYLQHTTRRSHIHGTY